MNIIKVNELRVEEDQYVMKSCLINGDHLVSVQSGKLSKKGPHIIGSERERELRMITLRSSGAQPVAIFVDETVEEIYERLAVTQFALGQYSKANT